MFHAIGPQFCRINRLGFVARQFQYQRWIGHQAYVPVRTLPSTGKTITTRYYFLLSISTYKVTMAQNDKYYMFVRQICIIQILK